MLVGAIDTEVALPLILQYLVTMLLTIYFFFLSSFY
jgi:hypothetical protein